MPVLVDKIEKQTEIASFIFDNYEQFCLIDKERVNYWLCIISNNIAELLDQYKESLSVEYFYPLAQLIKRFNETDLIIPQDLNNALNSILLIFEDRCDLEELKEVILGNLEILDF